MGKTGGGHINHQNNQKSKRTFNLSRSHPQEIKAVGSPPIRVYFFLGNFSAPMSLPRSLTLRTRSIAPRTFWSGVAVPRSKSCTTVMVVLHLVASSFCVIL